MIELVAIVPIALIASLAALGVLLGHEGATSAHRQAFKAGLATLFALPLFLVALATTMLSIFNAGTGFALVFAAVLGVVVLAGSVAALVGLLRLPRAGAVA